MPMFTSLEGSYVTVREVDVTTKAHQRHEGSPYSLLETTPRRRFSTTSGRPWGGLQTLTNFSGGNHNGRFLVGALLPPRSLQPPRVTRCTTKTKGGINFRFGECVDRALLLHYSKDQELWLAKEGDLQEIEV